MQRNSVKKCVEILVQKNIINPENPIQVRYDSYDWEKKIFGSERIFFPSTYERFNKIPLEESLDGHYFSFLMSYKGKNNLPDSDNPYIHPFMPSVRPTVLIVPVGDYLLSIDMINLESKCNINITNKDCKTLSGIPRKIAQKVKQVKNELTTRTEEIFSS